MVIATFDSDFCENWQCLIVASDSTIHQNKNHQTDVKYKCGHCFLKMSRMVLSKMIIFQISFRKCCFFWCWLWFPHFGRFFKWFINRCGNYLAGDQCEKLLLVDCPARMWGPNCDQECKCNAPFNCTRNEEDKGVVCRCNPNEVIDSDCKPRSKFEAFFKLLLHY